MQHEVDIAQEWLVATVDPYGQRTNLDRFHSLIQGSFGLRLDPRRRFCEVVIDLFKARDRSPVPGGGQEHAV